MMWKILPFLVVISLVISCSDTENKAQPFEEEEFIADTIFIDNTFPEFPSETVPKILEGLGLCTSVDSLIGVEKSACSSEIFRIFPIDTSFDYSDGFIIDTRRGVLANTTSKALLVFVNLNGQLDLRNFLKGTILEMRTNRSGHYDIVMEYRSSAVSGYVTVLHNWNEDTKSFIPVDVLEINRHFVKKAYKDSINNLYLKDFIWGY